MFQDTENFRKSELQLSQTNEQMAVFSAVDKEVTRNNTIVFSSISNDTLQIDQQFTRYNLLYSVVGYIVLDGVHKLYAVLFMFRIYIELYDNWVSYVSILTFLTMFCCTLQVVDFILLFCCHYFLHIYIMDVLREHLSASCVPRSLLVLICLSFFVQSAVILYGRFLQQHVFLNFQ